MNAFSSHPRKWQSPRLQQRRNESATRSAKPISLYLGAALALIFVAEGLIVKSFIFTGNDPVLPHYILSSLICLTMGLFAIFVVRIRNISLTEILLLAASSLWSVVSSIHSGQADNLFASVTFTLSVAGSFIFVPRLLSAAGYNTVNLVRGSVGVVTIISALLLVIAPSLVTDVVSGRFSGATISVAVACNVFLFATVLYGFRVRQNMTLRKRLVTGFMIVLAFSFLFLTYTRSLLLEAFALLMLLLFTDQTGHIKPKTMMIACIILSIGLFFLLLYFTINGFDIDQLTVAFRLADGGSTTDSRMGNWMFAIERITDQPWYGEGLLTKQTSGGGSLDLNAVGGSYNVIYDPHSLPLSLAVQAGIPFALVIMSFLILIHVRYLMVFGLSKSLASADFMIGIVTLIVMIPAGGDLTSMGNVIDRIYWILIGAMSYRCNLEVAARAQFAKLKAARFHGEPMRQTFPTPIRSSR